MPTDYWKVKDVTLEIVDLYSTKHEIVAGYLKPKSNPKYDASTKLAAIGLNLYVRRAIDKAVADVMYREFGNAWKGYKPEKLEKPETIGAFIELMADRTGGAVPFPEPT